MLAVLVTVQTKRTLSSVRFFCAAIFAICFFNFVAFCPPESPFKKLAKHFVKQL